MPLTQVCSCFDRYCVFSATFHLLLSFERENNSGGETATSRKGGISIHVLMYAPPSSFLVSYPLQSSFVFLVFHAVSCLRSSMEQRLDTSHKPSGVFRGVFRHISRAAHFRAPEMRANRAVLALPAAPKKARPEIAGLGKHAMVKSTRWLESSTRGALPSQCKG
jgi:hypothetical protein